MWFLCISIIVTYIINDYVVASLPDEKLSITQFITKYKYPVEVHTYETSDGYILKAHRIPHGVTNKTPKNVIILAHGMGGSAENYILLGPQDGSLAFYMADRGYDVWLFNARGTVHSRKHRSINPNRNPKKFWDFSWNEIGIYDLPATINYVLNATGAQKLFYVGHSQGTTSLMVMLSELPEMNDKIKVAALLAPAAHLEFTQSPVLYMVSRFIKLIARLLMSFNWYELLIPNSPMLNNILVALCRPKAFQDVCMDIIYFIGGTESGFVNKTKLPTILHFAPSGLAFRQVWHYCQTIISGEFRKFDYGEKKNMILYNDTKPPSYKLDNVKVPVAFFYAVEDPFANPRMVEELSKSFQNVILKHLVPISGWNHLDFLLAYNLKEVINEPLHAAFKPYEN